jgi:hypothetical protein
LERAGTYCNIFSFLCFLSYHYYYYYYPLFLFFFSILPFPLPFPRHLSEAPIVGSSLALSLGEYLLSEGYTPRLQFVLEIFLLDRFFNRSSVSEDFFKDGYATVRIVIIPLYRCIELSGPPKESGSRLVKNE